MAWLSENGGAFGGDGRIAAGGQSSGGNLVAAACLMARDQGRSLVTNQVLCYPWLDLGFDSESHRLFDSPVSRADDEWFASQYLAGQLVTPYVAPLAAQDLSGLPPTLVLGAGLDPVRATMPGGTRVVSGRTAWMRRTWSTRAARTPFSNFPGALIGGMDSDG